MMVKLIIPNWHPARVNKLIGCHWATKNRLVRCDRRMIWGYSAMCGMPIARGPRRVDLAITLAPRQRAADPDAYWKSTLDGLVCAKMLVDDNRQYVRLGNVTFDRGPERSTTIVLTDIDGEQP